MREETFAGIFYAKCSQGQRLPQNSRPYIAHEHLSAPWRRSGVAWRSVLKIHAGGLILSPAQLFTKISPFFKGRKQKSWLNLKRRIFSPWTKSSRSRFSKHRYPKFLFHPSCQHLELESFCRSCLRVASFSISGITTSVPTLWCRANRNTRNTWHFPTRQAKSGHHYFIC